MTEQEVFDTVVVHLRSMKKQSLDANGACVYRSPSGAKCAIGSIIPDELYSPSMEGRPVNNLYRDYPHLPHSEHLDLLDRLQETHDAATFWVDDVGLGTDGEGYLALIAADFNLKYTPRTMHGDAV